MSNNIVTLPSDISNNLNYEKTLSCDFKSPKPSKFPS